LIKIIFSALNEEGNLKKFLTNISQEMQLLQREFQIIACLDGSSDDSEKILRDYAEFAPVKILPLKNTRGLGLAYKRLFLDVVKNSADDDLVISLDADNTHDPQQMSEMIKHFEAQELDVLVASRFFKVSVVDDFPLHRKFISKSTSLILQNLFPIKKISGEKLQDYTSGYRVYKVEKLKKLYAGRKENFITEPEFTYTCEFLIKLSQLGCKIDELPISYDYGKKIGKSKLRILRNFWRLMVMLVNLAIQR
jgi:dolichol-phosphate mannosyltransferase